ncbi:TAXI family TRAP transporter solute-binding subunit [Carboxydochorda subterranea]|uniref:TAXI family TRAP transporter solute-binding subunit n=1 Tax=Carboxydichorda subterranea TaxID=3109565 RepID=A0ABZ1C1J7_9FIRM|nr:TAXI family TRAP transporter solute-binding subunit [Limnochorda sp. L945t]WRP18957.1 TAXI family TRAP transporter solute-binding subunit [Limnochorda sp. L945t]
MAGTRLAFVAAALVAALPVGASAAEFVTIAAGGTAGVYYPLGGALAEIFNQHVPGVNASVQATGASVANVNLLAQGQAELAFIQNDIAYYAANGTEMFQGRKVATLKGVATLYPEVIQIVALKQANIRSVADLKGKRVAVGDIGSGTEANARQILEAAGLTYKDVSVSYLSFAEAASNLRDGHVDAAFVTAGIPTAAIQDIAVQKEVTIVAVPSDLARKLRQRYPFYTAVTVPGGTYRGIDQDVATVAVKAMLVTRADLPDDLVFRLTRALFDNLPRLGQAHVRGKDVSLEGARDGMSLDLHPGAARFYQQAGG